MGLPPFILEVVIALVVFIGCDVVLGLIFAMFLSRTSAQIRSDMAHMVDEKITECRHELRDQFTAKLMGVDRDLRNIDIRQRALQTWVDQRKGAEGGHG